MEMKGVHIQDLLKGVVPYLIRDLSYLLLASKMTITSPSTNNNTK